MKIAPIAGPSQWRAPPIRLISSTNSGTVTAKVSATVTYDTKIAWMPPATPARKHEMASAIILNQNVGTPITSATSSSSWIANRPRPKREVCTYQAVSMLATAIARPNR